MSDDFEKSLTLVHAAQSGDAEALDRLFARYYDRVRRVVRARMGKRVRRLMDSADILQNTFVTAVKIFDRFEVRNEASLIRWLAQIAERQITDAAERASADKRNVDREVPLATSADLHPPGKGEGPFEALDVRDREDRLMEALGSLDEQYRDLIVERDLVGGEWGEIAERLGRPSGDAARMAYGTARAKLAVSLVEFGFDPGSSL